MYKNIFKNTKTIAVVGLSDNHERDSFKVAKYLQDQGFRIVPVNPNITEILGEKSYSSLEAIPVKIDMVNIFRKSEAAEEITDSAIKIGATIIWMQEGVINHSAAQKAKEAGLNVIMDKCVKKEHKLHT